MFGVFASQNAVVDRKANLPLSVAKQCVSFDPRKPIDTFMLLCYNISKQGDDGMGYMR